MKTNLLNILEDLDLFDYVCYLRDYGYREKKKKHPFWRKLGTAICFLLIAAWLVFICRNVF